MSKIKIYIFHTGKVVVDKAIPLHEKNPLAVTGFLRSKKKKMALPVSCYLIEHEKGLVLIDTGWHSKYVKEKPHRFLGLLDKVSTPVIKEGESIDCKLNELGYKASDLDYVFISHLDFDHISGVELVKEAKNIQASQEEINAARKSSMRYMKENWQMVNLTSFTFEETGLGPIGRSFDLFKDNSIQLIHTPGHSDGHCSVKVTGQDNKYILIGGDAAYLQESFEKQIIPGFTTNKKLAVKSLAYLTECRKDPLCLGVFVNHDPSISEQVLEV